MRLGGFVDDGSADTERFARMHPEQRLKLFLELCDLTDSIQRARPDASQLRRGTPVAAETEALLRRLMTQPLHG
jgi:hypothetical protein